LIAASSSKFFYQALEWGVGLLVRFPVVDLNAVTGGKDYANGGIKWDGTDAKLPGRKWSEGTLFAKPGDDIFNFGNNSKHTDVKWGNGKSRGSYDYKWESTAGYGAARKNGTTTGTIFMKLTDAAKKLGVKY